jgi:hypothetical protein
MGEHPIGYRVPEMVPHGLLGSYPSPGQWYCYFRSSHWKTFVNNRVIGISIIVGSLLNLSYSLIVCCGSSY